ncbi:hypothetical protein DCAR_0625626 [Daucus carota subsp. sativus]|uniref:Secreted protein n=1 Tax=Daucus carota subsp. sativus TaxID=79200 RepID=A0A164WKQ9_DAUCS|nr:PREDICTED: uncharacterized protein LOC108224427 [Daucus carota subsp. sativus]WOH06203.1 hypothetical protein DCAR_0625626 [Daucus carota subsp. sativus]
MSRPIILVFLLLLIVFTSQIDWNQQIVSEVEANPNLSRKQLDHVSSQDSVKEKIVSEVEANPNLSRKQLDHVSNQDSIKEKIILSQEKSIQKLNKLVQSLQEQLVQCRVINGDIDDPAGPLAELLHELEQQQLLDA